jgi:hypothetical protein
MERAHYGFAINILRILTAMFTLLLAMPFNIMKNIDSGAVDVNP